MSQLPLLFQDLKVQILLLNLQLPPFDFPQPITLLVEDAEMGKCLGVRRLEDL